MSAARVGSQVVELSIPGIVAGGQYTAGPDTQEQVAVAYKRVVALLQPRDVAEQYPADQVAGKVRFAGVARPVVVHRPVMAAYASALDTTLSQVTLVP